MYYIFVKDQDSHWYLIPADLEKEFFEAEEECTDYWTNFDKYPENYKLKFDEFEEMRINSYREYKFTNPTLI